jgi:Protein of unknown function (DUF3768)
MSTLRIRELKDAFRSTFSGGKVMMTSGVHELPDCVRADALVKVATFSQFTKVNDPYGEHDFGFFEIVGRTFYWKIDYYDGGAGRSAVSRSLRQIFEVEHDGACESVGVGVVHGLWRPFDARHGYRP